MAGDANGVQASASPSQVSLYCRSLDTFERSRAEEREERMTAWRSSSDDEEMRTERVEWCVMSADSSFRPSSKESKHVKQGANPTNSFSDSLVTCRF